jgi:hypothetical protein
MAVFWVVAPCSLVEYYQRFRGPCCLHHQVPDDRRQTSSYTPLWEPQILLDAEGWVCLSANKNNCWVVLVLAVSSFSHPVANNDAR